MDRETFQPDSLESLMLEVSEARKAGVFGSTPLDVDALVGGSDARSPVLAGPSHWYRHLAVGLPLAACIAMFFGVATLWQTGAGTGDGMINGTSAVSTFSAGGSPAAERCRTWDNFRVCFGGPGVPVGMDCRCVDFDEDGDVDLRDMGSMQATDAIN